MKIVVTVKQAAQLDEDFEILDDSTLDPDFLDYDLNEWDVFALEAAQQLAHAVPAASVVVLCVGPEDSDEGLYTCIAKGADRAVRVWSEDLDGVDQLAVARVLAAAIEREAPDIVLTGVQSSDFATAATGVAVAEHLGLPRVAVVSRIAYDPATGVLEVDRELEGGVIQVLRLGTPALLTVQTGLNEPRYATLRAVNQARQTPPELVAPEDLGVDSAALRAAAGSRVRRLVRHEVTGKAELLGDDPRAVASRILELVRDRLA